MKSTVQRLIWGLLVLVLLAMAGCNTMEGFGKDLQKVGSEIEQAADK